MFVLIGVSAGAAGVQADRRETLDETANMQTLLILISASELTDVKLHLVHVCNYGMCREDADMEFALMFHQEV